jgi:hypothetical protein
LIATNFQIPYSFKGAYSPKVLKHGLISFHVSASFLSPNYITFL